VIYSCNKLGQQVLVDQVSHALLDLYESYCSASPEPSANKIQPYHRGQNGSESPSKVRDKSFLYLTHDALVPDNEFSQLQRTMNHD
jgi:hypothetical protein